jgi:lysophospholipase L1-like esterase
VFICVHLWFLPFLVLTHRPLEPIVSPWILTATVLATLFAAEALARVWHDPQARDRTGDAALLPAATRHLSPRRLRHATRIVVLGDSIPFGWPLANHDGYPTRLEALLRTAHPGRAIAVINAAIGGNTAVLGLARVERDLLRWRPRIALLAFGLNDCHLARTTLDERRERAMFAQRRPAARLRALLRRSALLDSLWGALALRRSATDHHTEGGRPPHEQPRTTQEAYAHALRELVRVVRRCGARPYLLTMTPLGPSALAEGWDAATYARYDALLRQVAQEERAEVIDAGAAFPVGEALAPLLAADGLHLTAAGQEVVAGIIARRLEGERSIPDKVQVRGKPQPYTRNLRRV